MIGDPDEEEAEKHDGHPAGSAIILDRAAMAGKTWPVE
jgi:hypothetical protein